MIARITGTLEEVGAASVLVSTVTWLWYEVLVPACDLERLSRRLGQEVALHTIHYFEGDPSHGSQTPRLIGFLDEAARKFFDGLQRIWRATDLGRIKSVATIPAISTHLQQGTAGRCLAHIPPNMVRLCVGAEHPADVIADLDQALNRLTTAVPAGTSARAQ